MRLAAAAIGGPGRLRAGLNGRRINIVHETAGAANFRVVVSIAEHEAQVVRWRPHGLQFQTHGARVFDVEEARQRQTVFNGIQRHLEAVIGIVEGRGIQLKLIAKGALCAHFERVQQLFACLRKLADATRIETA